MTKVRLMRESDCFALATLTEQLGYIADETEIGQRFYELRHNPHHVIYVAETKVGEVQGFVHARRDQSLHEKPSTEIAALVVAEEARGLGIGKVLMEAAEAWTRQQGTGDIWLSSNIAREDAHKFYQRIGYQQMKTSHRFLKKNSTM